MNLLLLKIVAITVIIPDILSQNDGTDSTTSSPSLDCGYLNNSYTSVGGMTYNGECCNSGAVNYMETENPGWRTNQQELQTYMLLLFTGGYCNSTVEQSTAVLTSTTTVPETTTTVKKIKFGQGFSKKNFAPKTL
ncbi:hypothetical protein GCK72_004827 [Caenorhabditis remanei]|uniref:Uncharacterized protein n=1 Tax=Caenorhabditis remanei TaxID=31234 RepID=A0A6A5HDH1_CAERE|nr:hypothetical protein GCK72_004827 [Caenorhabditis remanei]KAF1764876.1 hypothetical protein GCK72_004827 [Caenorhabditis remanei]